MLKLIEAIETDWSKLLMKIYNNNIKQFKILENKINEEKIKYKGLQEIYPPESLIFKTFNFFNINELKVVIIGQDPYHKPEQAMGMCFSVPKHIKVPPSLKNIYKEIKNCYPNYTIPQSGDLTQWNKQGILLLNTSLTVRQASPNSHSKLWKIITHNIIEEISKQTNQIIFILWGNHAISKKKFIDTNKHYILESKHPSPLSANKGGWFGKHHFIKVNNILERIHKKNIRW